MDFHDNRNVKFSRLEPVTGAALVHAEGEWMNGADEERRVAVSIGPEVGNVTSMQVEDVIRSANRAGYDDVVFAGFGFDAAAQEAIEGGSHPRLRLHMALIRPDVAMDDLLKTQPGSQLFTVFAAPRVHGPTKQESGEYVVGVEGMDVYDPVSGTLYPTDRQRIAAWFLDTDYDGRTFCICQAFFPDRSKWDRLARALGDTGVVEREAFQRLSGFEGIAFPRPSRLADGEPWRVAVKVIDPRRQRRVAGSDREELNVIERIVIENFKSLRKVDLSLGRMNLFLGANASGKSNFLDALRVLEGIGNGFTIREILNGKPRSSTSEAWEGIRGGSAYACFAGADGTEEITITVYGTFERPPALNWKYDITFSPRGEGTVLREYINSGKSEYSSDDMRRQFDRIPDLPGIPQATDSGKLRRSRSGGGVPVRIHQRGAEESIGHITFGRATHRSRSRYTPRLLSIGLCVSYRQPRRGFCRLDRNYL